MNLESIEFDSGHPEKDLMRMRETAEWLCCSVSTIYRAMAKKKLPARRFGEHWVFSRKALREWIQTLPGVNL